MRRYGFSDSQWEWIKDLLPARGDHVDGAAADNRLSVRRFYIVTAPIFLAVICLSGSVTGKTFIDGYVAGAKAT